MAPLLRIIIMIIMIKKMVFQAKGNEEILIEEVKEVKLTKILISPNIRKDIKKDPKEKRNRTWSFGRKEKRGIYFIFICVIVFR